jgi:hypothetical protein
MIRGVPGKLSGPESRPGGARRAGWSAHRHPTAGFPASPSVRPLTGSQCGSTAVPAARRARPTALPSQTFHKGF